MMPGNPVVGSTVLRRPAIQSPGFVTTVSGWSINADGSAEFNTLTIRGAFSGVSIYTYSGTPALGNLVSSTGIASSMTDAEGNAILAGDTTYALVSGTYTATSLQNGQINAYTAPAASGPWTLVGSLAFDPLSGWLAVTSAPLNCKDHLYVSGGSFEVTGSTPAVFTGAVTIDGTLTVGGSTSTATAGLTDGTISGASATGTLPNGGITGTSGAASAGTAHTHGGGSYSVISGAHAHNAGSYAVTNGTHQHAY